MNQNKKTFKLSYILLAVVLIAVIALGIFAYSHYAQERARQEAEHLRVMAAADAATYISVLGNDYTPDEGSLTVHLPGEPQVLTFSPQIREPLDVKSFESLAKSIVAKGDIAATLYKNNEPVFEGNLAHLGSYKGLDGVYSLQLTNSFQLSNATESTSPDALENTEGELVYTFEIAYNPLLEFLMADALDQEHLQGDMLMLDALGLAGAIIETNLPNEIKFYENGNKYTAFIPFGYTLKPQEYFVKATKADASETYTFEVKARQFVQQHITVSKDVADSTVNSAAANKEFSDVLNPAKAVVDETLYVTAPFIAPLTGRISTEFGMQRFANNSKNPSRHSGIDIAGNKAGTPIVASNRGRVIVSQFLALTGNTVVIEHGFGLKSIYYHMDELSVEKDAMVEQGQQVGTVGTTGYSTGPHLHFSMCINNVWIKPLYDYES